MSTVQVRIDEATKQKAYDAFDKIGISPMDAVRLFLRYVADHQELPFTEVSVVVSSKNKDSDILEIVRDQLKNSTSVSVK